MRDWADTDKGLYLKRKSDFVLLKWVHTGFFMDIIKHLRSFSDSSPIYAAQNIKDFSVSMIF